MVITASTLSPLTCIYETLVTKVSKQMVLYVHPCVNIHTHAGSDPHIKAWVGHYAGVVETGLATQH